MTSSGSRVTHDLVLDCGEWIGEGGHGEIGVLITPTGGLRIVCHKHETIIAFWQNNEVAERLQSLALRGCEECSHTQGDVH